MGDYQDFCESFGGCASDPDFMDKWIDEYLVEEIKEKKTNLKTKSISPIPNDFLPKGKIVHIIKLLAAYPAKPVGIIWNSQLTKPFSCVNGNYLSSTENDDPASWFVQKGFTVRSNKTGGYWYQIAFKESNEETLLCGRERKEYELICSTLNPNWIRNS